MPTPRPHMRTTKLLQLASFLDDLPPKRFDMSQWCSHWGKREISPNSSCGTQACALGWATCCFKGEGLYLQGGCVYLQNTGALGWDAGAAFFGLTDREANTLFSPANTTEGRSALDTPKGKAKQIRALVRKERERRKAVKEKEAARKAAREAARTKSKSAPQAAPDPLEIQEGKPLPPRIRHGSVGHVPLTATRIALERVHA